MSATTRNDKATLAELMIESSRKFDFLRPITWQERRKETKRQKKYEQTPADETPAPIQQSFRSLMNFIELSTTATALSNWLTIFISLIIVTFRYLTNIGLIAIAGIQIASIVIMQFYLYEKPTLSQNDKK